MENRCIHCGVIIPEGRWICPRCEKFPPTPTSVVTKARKPNIITRIKRMFSRKRTTKINYT